MDNLVEILNNIVVFYENASQNDDHYDEVMAQSTTWTSDRVFENDPNLDERWFIFCSRPHGSVTLIPTFLALIGGKSSSDTCLYQLYRVI